MSGGRIAAAIRRAGERAAERRVASALARAQALAASDLPFARATIGEGALMLAAGGLKRRVGGRLGLRWAELQEEARAGAREGRP
jgi:hypothetical protein